MNSKNSDLNKASFYFYRGVDYISKGDWLAAKNEFEKSLQYCENRISTLANLSAALIKLKEFDRAEKLIKKASKLDPCNPELFLNSALIDLEGRRYELALEKLDRVLSIKSDYTEAWNARGSALNDLCRNDEAVFSYDRAIELKPDYAEVWNNRGSALNDLGRNDEAVLSYDRAIELKPDYAEAWNNRGSCLSGLGYYEGALESLERAFLFQPRMKFLLGSLLHTRMKICDWGNFDSQLNYLQSQIENHENCSTPFPILGLFDSPKLQHSVAHLFSQTEYKPATNLPPIKKRRKSRKIRLGYYSADFHNHATSYLAAELFESHNRNQFELIGFSFGPDTADSMRARVISAFDKFFNVSEISDIEIARLSRRLSIDIAIDLKGYTKGGRPQIFAERCAPIQINYLGFPGSLGSHAYDYIIADKMMIPENSKSFYSEKVIYLPASYQINDSKRTVSLDLFTNYQFGIPDDAFVFCCFNNTWKILPNMFDSWMRILGSVENSVLWLLEDNPTAAQNLKKEAELRRVDSTRLIFAKRLDLQSHLARHRLADLFLDTFPCGAHTTASDAIWSGLPIVTLRGESFASRVAASLLNSVNLSDLITTTPEEYELTAINLAINPDKLLDLRRRLTAGKLASSLFDGSQTTGLIESGYLSAYDRYHNGLAPDHIYVV